MTAEPGYDPGTAFCPPFASREFVSSCHITISCMPVHRLHFGWLRRRYLYEDWTGFVRSVSLSTCYEDAQKSDHSWPVLIEARVPSIPVTPLFLPLSRECQGLVLPLISKISRLPPQYSNTDTKGQARMCPQKYVWTYIQVRAARSTSPGTATS
jgi:hypothetical protein